MSHLDPHVMDGLQPETFRSAKPFPWAAFDGFVREDSLRALRETAPAPEQFKPVFGRRRRHGQASHDRFALEYRAGLDLAAPWREFIAELNGPAYRDFIARTLGIDRFLLHCHWHYTPRGCSVSPHCDAPWKLGSQVFYLNTEDDWDEHWGGETLMLDDGGQLDSACAPGFGDFVGETGCPSVGNRSVLFQRTPSSWHGVRPLTCPEGALRKVFIVEFRTDSIGQRIHRFVSARR